jgi:NhaA family Na+:H+ antiporter
MAMNIREIIKHEAFSGILLLVGLIAAGIISNTGLYKYYLELVNLPFSFSVGGFETKTTFIKLVNDGLMSLFFLLIGLELKYHLIEGEYKTKKKLILPLTAALGGIVIPSLIYIYFNFDKPTINGWAIPIATDTAFVLGLLTFFGRTISVDLRVFILGFSLIDDVFAIIVLTLFYTKALNVLALLLCFTLVSLLALLNYLKYSNVTLYMLIGVLLWVTIVESGIHGTLAGIVLAFFIPIKSSYVSASPLQRLESGLHPLVNYFILPVFAFVNSEIPIKDMTISGICTDLSLGIILGLFIGKQAGIFIFSYLAIKFRCCTLPMGTSWPKYYAICILGGIGFTLSLFIGNITFMDECGINTMRLSVIIGSVLSALCGVLLLKCCK